jgi:hypothetical protein
VRRLSGREAAPFRAFLDAYNRCFYDRDLKSLRALYASDGNLVYFDNHPGCDSATLAHHLRQVDAFFARGKQTESGGIEPLLVEGLTVFASDASAIMLVTLRYASAPTPGVRATFVLQREGNSWRIRHIHFSFDPNEERPSPRS